MRWPRPRPACARSCRSVSPSTDPYKQVTEMVGSGPYRFKADERVAGSRVVYQRNTKYVPRTERHARCDRRPEGRALRPHRVADHPRRRHRRGGDAERRDRLVADAERRSAAAAEEAGAPEGRDGQSHRHDRHAAVQPPQSAVRQSGAAPRDAGCGRAGGLHDRRRRHRREPVARQGRRVLSRHAAGERRPAWRC